MSLVEAALAAAPTFDPGPLGLGNTGRVWANLSPAALTEHAVRRREGLLTDLGAVVAYTGKRTGRSPKDKYTVQEPGVAEQVDWTANRAAQSLTCRSTNPAPLCASTG